MKVGRLNGAGALALDEVPEPTAGPGEVVVEMAACGVCGTDLEKLRGNYRTAGILGHEPVGRVRATGSAVVGVAVGDRVFVHHHVPCYACEVCRKGDFTFCPTYARSNIDPGGFSEHFRVPRENVERHAVLRLGPSVSWEVGALLEPAGCARTALGRVGFRPGDSVFIVGLGPVGLLYARLARAMGARWVGGAEPSELRRSLATKGGVDAAVDPRESGVAEAAVRVATSDQGVDLAVVATGAPPALALGARLPRRGGTLNLFGLPESGSRLDADLQALYLRGIRVIPTYATTEADIADVHAMVVDGRLHLEDLVTHRVPLEALPSAIEQAGRPETAVKVVVTGPAFAK
jgi:L-iditol 2-dehydrogenase